MALDRGLPTGRGIERLKERLAARAGRLGDVDQQGAGLSSFIADLLRHDTGVQLEASLGCERELDAFTVDLVSLALFGVRAAMDEALDVIDLRGVWSLGQVLPSLLPSSDEAKRLGRPHPRAVEPNARGALTLGRNSGDHPVVLVPSDRDRHAILLGATGTGKSTALLNLLAQDMRSGEGVILIDPHGGLADDALALVPIARREDLNLLDFDSIFLDEKVRKAMLERCTDPKVIEFWTKLAPAVTHDEGSLNNIAPYVTCKLAQFTGNPLMRRILCGGGEILDLGRAMDKGCIVILKMPKGLLGQSDTELLSAVMVMQIAQAGMARAGRPRDQRRPVRVYIDEFHTCAGEGLADLLAEARKFGIALVLAAQSLGQVDGGGRRPNTGAAALANAANLIAFRLGAPDAARLGPWFAPDIAWGELCQLPDFHAAVRVLDHGRPTHASVIRTDRPPSSIGVPSSAA